MIFKKLTVIAAHFKVSLDKSVRHSGFNYILLIFHYCKSKVFCQSLTLKLHPPHCSHGTTDNCSAGPTYNIPGCIGVNTWT